MHLAPLQDHKTETQAEKSPRKTTVLQAGVKIPKFATYTVPGDCKMDLAGGWSEEACLHWNHAWVQRGRGAQEDHAFGAVS